MLHRGFLPLLLLASSACNLDSQLREQDAPTRGADAPAGVDSEADDDDDAPSGPKVPSAPGRDQPAPFIAGCACEDDADACDAVGDQLPESTDLCQTWTNVTDDRVNLYAAFLGTEPLRGLSPAILGFQFDLDMNAATTPERCSGCAHHFAAHPSDAEHLGDGMISIGFEEYLYLQLYEQGGGTPTLDLAATFDIDCADVRRAGNVLWVSFPRDLLEAEAFRLSAYTYGDINAFERPFPDLASGTELFYEPKGGLPDIEEASFQAIDEWDCRERVD